MSNNKQNTVQKGAMNVYDKAKEGTQKINNIA